MQEERSTQQFAVLLSTFSGNILEFHYMEEELVDSKT